MLYEREKQIAIAAVTAATKVCEQVRREQRALAMEKSDRTPVTIADFGAQAVICQAIAEAFPTDSVIAEEDSTLLRSPQMAERLAQVTKYVQAQISDATPEKVTTWIDQGNGKVESRYWTLDPIDGTKGYVRGDQYAVALALVEQGEVKLGVLGCPALPIDATKLDGEKGVLFVAVRGQGTTKFPLAGGEPRPVHVTDAITQRVVESVVSEHGNRVLQEAVAQAAGLTAPSLRIDSQAKYGVVAQGEAALYIRLPFPHSSERRENTWDHAAGSIVVEEAGGRVTDMYGQRLNFAFGTQLSNNRGIIASNGAIHQAVLAAIAQQTKD